MTVVLAVSLRAGDTIRTGGRWNLTRPGHMPDGPTGVWQTLRRCQIQRQTHEHVQVAVTRDGHIYGTWNADTRWPRPASDAIARARRDAQETTAA